MDSIFTKIINREIPAYIVCEDDKHIAILDAFPIAKGHTLVIPKKEEPYIFDLEPNALSDLHLFSQKVAKAMDKALDCKRIGTAVIGLEVPHTHIHLVPINGVGDIDFKQDKLKLEPDEFKEILASIQACLD